MEKIAVVIRQLPGMRPVTSKVITEPKYSLDDLEHYFNEDFENHKNHFVKQFPEFAKAEWYLDIIDVY